MNTLVTTLEGKKQNIKQHEGKKLNWKLWSIIGGLCGSVFLTLFIVLAVRNRSTGKKDGVDNRENNFTENDEAQGSRASKTVNKVLHEPGALSLELPLPKDFIEPTPESLLEEVGKVIKSVDNPTDFESALNGLRGKAQPPKGLHKVKIANYADNLVEREMRRAFLESVVVGDEEKIKFALEKYHKAVLQTKAVIELPSDAKDIKDIEMYQVVRKCLSEGTLSASDKTKLENILLSPEQIFTMVQTASQYLGYKLKRASEQEAAAIVKVYFCGSEEVKAQYESFSYWGWWAKFPPKTSKSKNRLEFRCRLSETGLPVELQGADLYQSDAKTMLLELICGYPSTLLEELKRDGVPSIDTINAAIAGFPQNDPLFMANFSRLLNSFLRDLELEMVVAGLNTDEIKDVIDHCDALLAKYVTLVGVEPKDPRITSLQEWRAYKNDPSHIDTIRSLLQSVSSIGLDPYYVHQYVSENNKALGKSSPQFHESYQKLVKELDVRYYKSSPTFFPNHKSTIRFRSDD